MKRVLLVGLGILLIGVGIVGLFLPILQGWAMIFMGLALVSPSLARRLRGRAARKFFKNGIVHLKEWEKAGIQAGFTTRHFPLVLHRTDDLLRAEDQKKLALSLLPGKGAPPGRFHTKFALLDQVHGDGVAVIEDGGKYTEDGFYRFRECDAALTNIPGLTLLVLTADCLSVFLSAGAWVGIAHAGWRGSRKKITLKTLELLIERSGVEAGEVKVILGPCIGADQYEVGPEFREYFPPSSLKQTGHSLRFDLAKENRRHLLEAGVSAKNISDHGICTVEENSSFYSFRKEKDKAGRQISFISRF